MKRPKIKTELAPFIKLQNAVFGDSPTKRLLSLIAVLGLAACGSGVATANDLFNPDLDQIAVGPQINESPVGWQIIAVKTISGAFYDGADSEPWCNVQQPDGYGLFFKPFQGSTNEGPGLYDLLNVYFYQDVPSSSGTKYTLSGYASCEANFCGLLPAPPSGTVPLALFQVEFLNASGGIIQSNAYDLIANGMPLDGPGSMAQFTTPQYTAPTGTVTVRVGATLLNAYSTMGAQSFFVDAFDLESVPQTGVQLTNFGLIHTPLGNATLSGQSNRLTVANIGSNGVGGVSIAMPANATEWGVVWQPLDPTDSLPVGAYLQERGIGLAGTGSNGVWATLTMTKAGTSNYVETADFSPIGVTNLTLQVYNGTNLVAQLASHNGNIFSSIWHHLDFHAYCKHHRPRIKITWTNMPVLISLNSGPTVTGDSVVIIPDIPSWVYGLSFPPAVQILASQIPMITITNECVSVSYAGLDHTVLGNATLSVQSNQLTVANIGSDGVDGVAIAMPPNATEWGVAWQPLDPTDSLPVGAYLQERGIGPAGTGNNGVWATLTMTKAGTSNYVETADFSPIGVTNLTLQVYNGTNLVAQLASHNGNIFSSIWHHLDFHAYCTNHHPGIMITWNGHPVSLSLNGGPTVTGDSVVIIPDIPSWVSGLSFPPAVQIVAAHIPVITITSETVSPLVLSAALSGSDLIVEWSGNGILQVSGDLVSWTDLPSAASPYTTSITAAAEKFYRVRQ